MFAARANYYLIRSLFFQVKQAYTVSLPVTIILCRLNINVGLFYVLIMNVTVERRNLLPKCTGNKMNKYFIRGILHRKGSRVQILIRAAGRQFG